VYQKITAVHILGIAIIAFPASIITSGYMEEINERNKSDEK
jgi:hypothetical protein